MKLKELRRKNGLTQEQVAVILGIPKKTYQNYERGVREADSEVLCTLADHYGVSLDELVGRDHSPVTKTADEAREDELISIFHQMNQQGQNSLLVVARGLAQSFPK